MKQPMKYHETCQCCNHKVTAYTINLSSVMLDAFKIFAEKYVTSGRGLHKGEIGLQNAQYSNFQNLQHFGIITQVGQLRLLTPLGFRFYKNNGAILNPAGMMGGQTLPLDHPARITHGQRELVTMKDVEQKYQDHREKYQTEKTLKNNLI